MRCICSQIWKVADGQFNVRAGNRRAARVDNTEAVNRGAGRTQRFLLVREPLSGHGVDCPGLRSMMSESSTKISVPSVVATAQRCGTAQSRPIASPASM